MIRTSVRSEAGPPVTLVSPPWPPGCLSTPVVAACGGSGIIAASSLTEHSLLSSRWVGVALGGGQRAERGLYGVLLLSLQGTQALQGPGSTSPLVEVVWF